MSELLKDLSEGLQEAVDYEVGQEVKRLKTTEGGVSTMCDVMEKYIQEGRDEGREDEILSSVADGDYSIKRGAEKH